MFAFRASTIRACRRIGHCSIVWSLISVRGYESLVPGSRDARERAILGTIVKYGPSSAAELARTGRPAIRYLSYDWSLNDVER